MEGLVNFPHLSGRPFTGGPDNHPVGLHEVVDGKTLPEELRIAHHIKISIGLPVALNRLGHLLGGLHGDRALVDDDPVTSQAPGDFPSHTFDEAQIHRTIGLRRRRDGDEHRLGTRHAFSRG